MQQYRIPLTIFVLAATAGVFVLLQHEMHVFAAYKYGTTPPARVAKPAPAPPKARAKTPTTSKRQKPPRTIALRPGTPSEMFAFTRTSCLYISTTNDTPVRVHIVDRSTREWSIYKNPHTPNPISFVRFDLRPGRPATELTVQRIQNCPNGPGVFRRR